jgi:hypothetical protein
MENLVNIFQMEDDLIFFEIEKQLKFVKIENDLKFYLKIWRQSTKIWKWKTT